MLPSSPRGLSAESLLESHEFTLQIGPGVPLKAVEFTDENKNSVAQRVLDAMSQFGLELDFNVPNVRLLITKQGPSELDYNGKPCIDLDGTVFIFTTTGPKHFQYRFAILAENTRFMSEGGHA